MDIEQFDQTPSIYASAIQQALPRVLSMLDREHFSKTYGCADRVFWSWKFTDFPGARFQEIAYVLAELTTNPRLFKDFDFQSNTLLDWTKASINYWTTLQHRDGSFDEAYPFERSLAATAFTAFYVGQAFLKIKDTYSDHDQSRLMDVFKSAGNWLCHNDEHHGVLSNHLAAAAAALDTLTEITADPRFSIRRDYFIQRILQHQSEEGWYEEYGGADPGYQTHTTFYLGKIWSRTHDQRLLNSLQKSLQYFWNFIHVDGSIGGEYGSRNTRFYMPAGFEILAEKVPEAKAVAHFMSASLKNQRSIGLSAMDTYNVLPLINNYFFALHHENSTSHKTIPLPFNTLGIRTYPKSGHIILSTPHYQAIISTSKGGAINVFSKRSDGQYAQWSNAGVVMAFKNGRVITSQGLHCSHIKKIETNKIHIDARFTAVNQMLMSPQKFILFRLLNVISIVYPSFAYALKNVLVNILVRKNKKYPVEMTRQIEWNEDTISVTDEIVINKAQPIKKISVGGRFSAIHMGSSRYFEWQELSQHIGGNPLSPLQLNELCQTGKLTVTNHWSVK